MRVNQYQELGFPTPLKAFFSHWKAVEWRGEFTGKDGQLGWWEGLKEG